MHYKWKQWQEDSGLDSKLAKMCHQRRKKKIEILYHLHYISQQESLLSSMKAKLWDAQREYEEIDLDMALIDGRLWHEDICEEEKPKKTKKKTINKSLKSMTDDQREQLIAELEAMGGEK